MENICRLFSQQGKQQDDEAFAELEAAAVLDSELRMVGVVLPNSRVRYSGGPGVSSANTSRSSVSTAATPDRSSH